MPTPTMDSSKLPITGPCPIDLDAIGFDRSQRSSHCSHCDKSVHILSNMTERDAKAFLKEHAGQKICVSYARDAEGRVRFKPEPSAPVVPISRLRRRRPAAAAVAGLGLAAALAACTPHGPHDQPAGEMVPAEQVEPCDGGKTQTKTPPFEEVVDGMLKPDPMPLAGAAVIPEPEMIEGEIAVEPEPTTRGEMAVPPKHG